MTSTTFENGSDELATIDAKFEGIGQAILNDFTVQEVAMVESLLTPGIQTTVKIHSHLHNIPMKNLDQWKKQLFELKIRRPILKAYGFETDEMTVRARVYRLANRKLINPNNEEYTLYGCDDSLLNNYRSLVSNHWVCKSPSTVVQDTLTQCCGVPPDRLFVEQSVFNRDYMAENIHPFEVVKQQCDVALTSDGNDPSFLHFMTYENNGSHHFKSIKSMSASSSIINLTYSENAGVKDDKTKRYGGYRNPRSILQYSFPCDFDLLADLMNGVDLDGSTLTSMITVNPFLGQYTLSGNQAINCGIGSGVFKVGLTNYNSAEQQDSCNIGIEQYLLKRQGRLALMEPDKVGLRLTVPWNPIYHAGKVITVKLYNKNMDGIMLYGSGDYLISSMIHTVKRGGYSTTTMDCVSTTVGQGIL